MAYPTASELVNDSEVDELVSASEVEQEAWYLSAKIAVEDFCDQTFDSETGAKVIDGRGGRELFLPRRLEALTAFSVQGASLGLADVVLDPDLNKLILRPDLGWANAYERMMAEVQGQKSWTFPEGQGNITVTGTWGWTVFPQAVRLALRQDMEDQARADSHQIGQGFAALRSLGVEEIQQSGMRVRWGKGGSQRAHTLTPRGQRLLGGYIWTSPVGYVR